MTYDGIVPDDKDWTWVLERACPECGFDSGALDVGQVGHRLRENATSWLAVLDARADALRTRSRPDRWSTLEYAAHVRDVHRLYLERLTLMLTEDDPLYPNWDQDETARTAAYHAQAPEVVAAELSAAAEALASAFDAVTDAQWSRSGRRGDGASFTVDSFARYLLHDPVHHLWDVTGSAAASSGRQRG